MASPGENTLDNIKKTLEPYVRPREEVARIRQILAAHLDTSIQGGTPIGPLALVDTQQVGSSTTARGLQEQYLAALQENIKARSEFDVVCHTKKQPTKPKQTTSTSGNEQYGDRLREHLASIRLRQRRDKLQVIEGSLNSLEQKPAASPGLLDPDKIFKDSRPLPSIPKELMAGLGADKTVNGPHIKGLIDQLERHVLQAKLLLKREEQLLDKVKSQSTVRPGNISESAKLSALNRTRTELINWIETELGKAAGDDNDADSQEAQKHRARAGESLNMEEQLASIKEKYAQYLEARKTLLQLINEQPQPGTKPPTKDTKPPFSATPSNPPPPSAHLLSPYLQQLLSLSREQKGLIAQKSHLNNTIFRQLKENNQILDHLAEESHLIPAHPMPGGGIGPGGDGGGGGGVGGASSRSNAAAFAEATSGGISGPSDRVRPWVFAADSAKIATLEAVAEKIEEGQIALEGSMRTLGEIQEMLGPASVDGHNDDGDGNDGKAEGANRGRSGTTTEDDLDLWMPGDQTPTQSAGARRHTMRKVDKPTQPKTAWDMLDGNLGLLRAEK
ncbi:uncharacterized protein C8A04DRAFT_36475 [Dichotomopilus funicola]|uniref:Uncharacterized protein n=1 Tax=Dichotomopilus funicola TaxID=1934379 RepID=A0AAN6ZNR7_9PEZI|nr:hypothetical protein C8A04DRAFT_36475 [Dichotomopilus funicola]